MTHVNAFAAEVEEKKQALAVAQNALAEAEAALKAHPDFVKPSLKSEAPVEPTPKLKVKKSK